MTILHVLANTEFVTPEKSVEIMHGVLHNSMVLNQEKDAADWTPLMIAC
jgi:hypothetical protein